MTINRHLRVILILTALIVSGALLTRGVLRLQHRSELVQGAFTGDLTAVRRCVKAGVDIDARPVDWENSGGTVSALTAATLMGHEEIVRYLLDHGANPNLSGMNNPLILACWKKQPTIARLLLDHGADPNARGEGTPLYAAESTGQTELAALLRERGAR